MYCLLPLLAPVAGMNAESTCSLRQVPSPWVCCSKYLQARQAHTLPATPYVHPVCPDDPPPTNTDLVPLAKTADIACIQSYQAGQPPPVVLYSPSVFLQP
jgi:hypothetical protein